MEFQLAPLSDNEHMNNDLLAAGGVVYRRTSAGTFEVLLIKKVHGDWSLPKGHRKPGETEREAAIREIEEETGIRGEIIDELGQVVYMTSKTPPPRRKVVDYFLIQAQSDQLSPSPEEKISEIGWFSVEQAHCMLRRERLRTLVETAHEMLKQLSHRQDRRSRKNWRKRTS